MSEPVQRDLEAEAWRLYDGAIDAKDFSAAQKVMETIIDRIRGSGGAVKGDADNGSPRPQLDTSLQEALDTVNSKGQ